MWNIYDATRVKFDGMEIFWWYLVFLEERIRFKFDPKRRFLAHCAFPSASQKPPSSSSIDSAVISRLERLWRDSCGMSHSAPIRRPRYAIWRDTKFFIAALIPSFSDGKKMPVTVFFPKKLRIQIAKNFILASKPRQNCVIKKLYQLIKEIYIEAMYCT